MNNTNKGLLIVAALATLSFSYSAQAGMYIMNNQDVPQIQKSQVHTVASPKVFAVTRAKERLSSAPIMDKNKRPYNVISEFSKRENLVSAKPVIVGPVGYADSVPISIFLQQISPDGWSLDCTSFVCGDKVVSWHSDGRLKWMDLFYRVVSPKGEYDISFNVDSSVASISYIRGNVIDWKVDGNKTLNDNLLLWSKAAGWDLKWNTIDGSDWEIGNSFVITGTFENAVKSLIKAFRKKGVILTANKFNNNIIEIKQLYSEYSFQ